MPEKLDLIWYENATRPATDEREPASVKQSHVANRQKPQEPSATQPEKVKPAKDKASA